MELSAGNFSSPDDSNTVKFIIENSIEINADSISFLNTSLNGFQVYNPLLKKSAFYKHLGNLGLAYKNLCFSEQQRPVGIDFGTHSFDIYEFKSKDIKYYTVRSPFTELYYVMGSKNEQLLRVLHTQNINKNFNAGVEFQKLASEGFYLRQKSDDWNLSFFSWYKSTSGRYKLLANVIWNNIKVEENGGISEDSLFENTPGINKGAIDVNLIGAKNEWKGNSYYIKQYLDLGKKKTLVRDSVLGTTDDEQRAGDSRSGSKHVSGNNRQMVLKDTLGSDSVKVKDSDAPDPTSRISHSFYFERRALVYQDDAPSSNFYPFPFPPKDSVNTFDSTYFSTVENKISLTTFLGRKPGLTSSLDLMHQHVLLIQDDHTDVISSFGTRLDTTLQNLIIGGNVRKTGVNTGKIVTVNKNEQENDHYSNNSWNWEIAGDYNFYGSNKNDYSIRMFLLKRFKNSREHKKDRAELSSSNGNLSACINIQKRAPRLIYNIYSSNNFTWDSIFMKTDLLYGKLEYALNKRYFRLAASFSHILNYIYFDNNASPKQLNDPIEIFTAYLYKDFKLGKWHLNNRVIYQYVIGEKVIRVPELISGHSVYYENYLFKKALLAQIGFDVLYNTTYYADSYMPATGMFYLQNEKKIGNYPYIDVFVNLKIKMARLFLKFEHINSGFTGNTYYLVPHYPMPDRALKFGVSWIFYD
ncbi:MAG: putative porin [Bacteroidota bacterium]